MKISRLLPPLLAGSAAAGITIWVSARTEFLTLWVLAPLLLVVGIAPLVHEWRTENFELITSRNAFLAYYLLQNGIWTIYMLASGRTVLRFFDIRASYDALVLAMIYAILGLIGFHLGYRAQLSKRLALRLPVIPGKWNWQGGFALSIIVLAVSVAVFNRLMSIHGGIHSYVEQWGEMRQTGLEGEWYFVWASVTLPTLPLLFFYIGSLRFRTKIYYLLTCISIIYIFATGTIVGFRSYAIAALVQLAVVRHYLHKRVRLTIKLIPLAFTFLVLFAAFAKVRDTVSDLESIPSSMSSTLVSGEFWDDFGYSALARFQGSEMFARLIDQIPKVSSFQWGAEAFVDILTAPVPRLWWPGKPTSESVTFAQTFFPGWAAQGTGGYSPTWLGEVYWNFHVPGIIIFTFLLGAFCKAFDRWVKNNQTNPSVVLVYSYFFVFVVWLAEAPLSAFVMMETFLPIFALLFVINFVGTAREQPGRSRIGPTKVAPRAPLASR